MALNPTNPWDQRYFAAVAAGDCSFNYNDYPLWEAPVAPPACWLLKHGWSAEIADLFQDPANWAILWRYSTTSGVIKWYAAENGQFYHWNPDTDFESNAPPSRIALWQSGAVGGGTPGYPAFNPYAHAYSSPAEQEAAIEETVADSAAFTAESAVLRDLINRVIPATFGQWQNALLAVNQPSGDVANAVLQVLADFAASMDARYRTLLANGMATGQPIPAPPPFPYALVPNAPAVETLSPVAGDVVAGSAVPVDYGELPPGSVPAEGTPLEAIPEEWLPQLEVSYTPSGTPVYQPTGPVSYQPAPIGVTMPPPDLSFGPDTLQPADMNGQVVPVAPVKSGAGVLLALGIGAAAVAFLAVRAGRRGRR
jgi:hypothetical protein